MQIQVRKDPAAQRIAHTNWNTQTLNRNVISPALRDIADKIIDTLKDAFNGGVSGSYGSIKYQGGMAGGFSTVDVNSSTIGIAQSQPYEKFIREGTAGPYSGFPRPVVKWATDKLGVTTQVAFAIAKSVQINGTAKAFVPLHPAGDRRFEYPEWAVEVKHKTDLDQWAKGVGGAVVKFVVKGGTRRISL
jgi:hypothetical protein